MNGLLNWFSQVASITKFGLMTVPQRRGSVVSTIVGVAGVVLVLVGIFSILLGFRSTMNASAAPDSAIILRTGADSEMVSGFGRPDTKVVADAPGVAHNAQGPLASAELFVIIDLPKRSTGTDANVPLRGVEAAAMTVRDKFKIVQGRMFEWGKNEVIVGVGAAQAFSGLDLGGKVKVGAQEWPIVGVFTCGGGLAESEIWTDAKILQGAYRRGDSFQSVYVKLDSAGSFDKFKDSLTSNPQVNVAVQRQADYYSSQSARVSGLIISLGLPITLLMAVGAIFGALNTMYSAVATRTREIATLRALGFGSGAIVIALMIESVLLAVAGGVLGGVIAYIGFNNYHATTLNWQSFSQVTFAFAVTPALLLAGIVLATVIGLFGGLLPAIRAARLPIASALREI